MNNEFNTQEAKDRLKELLQEGEVIVTFNKINGDTRVMSCTLNSNMIPVEFHPKVKEEQANQQSDNVEMKKTEGKEDKVCVVYDVNAKGWRSFRWDNVTNVEYT